MTYRRWISIFGMALWTSGWVAAGSVYAATDGYTLDDLKLDSAGALVDVCTIEQGHQDFAAGRAFCYGFFEGAIRYAKAISGAADHKDLVCAPPETTRLQAVEVFVNYMNENSQYMDDGPIDAIYRALMHRWPCTE